MKRKAALEFIIELEKRFKGPLQGSEEWYKIRERTTDNPRGRIGGSEIASLIGYNPYTSAKELVKQSGDSFKIIDPYNTIEQSFSDDDEAYQAFTKACGHQNYSQNVEISAPRTSKFYYKSECFRARRRKYCISLFRHNH